MGVQWRLVLCLSFWMVCSAVKAQSSEDAALVDDAEDYDDWTDRFDDIFKDLDDYEDTLKKINDARDQALGVNESDEPLKVDEEDQNEKTLENRPEVDNGLQIEDDEAQLYERQGEIELPNEDNSFDEEEIVNVNPQEDDEEANELKEDIVEDDLVSNEEVIGDENMNGNAPPNDYDPLELDEFETKESVEAGKPIDAIKSPYSEQIDFNPDLFDDNIDFEEVDDDEAVAAAQLESKDAKKPQPDEEFKSIFQETLDILNNDSGNNNTVDEAPASNEQIEMPENIVDKSDIVDQKKDIDSNDDVGSESFEGDSIQLSKEIEESKDDVDKEQFKGDSKAGDENSSEKEKLELEELNALIEKQLKEIEDTYEDDDDSDDISEVKDDDSMEKDRQELAELNALIEKQLSEIENMSEDEDDTEEDYHDFEIYDTLENKANKEEEIPAVKYENDAIDPNEADSEEKKEDVLGEDVKSVVGGAEQEVHQLSSKEIDDKVNNFKSLHQADIEFDAALSDAPAVHMKLSLDDAIEITSPDYPSPYPGNNVIDWFFDGEEGAGIEFNITDLFVDGDAGDYLLIKPGGMDMSSSDGILFTYQLRHERKYRFFDVDKMFVRFESRAITNNFYRGFKFSVKFIDRKVERVVEPEPDPEPVAQEPEQTWTIYLAGVAPHEFRNVSELFRMILVDMTTMYVIRENIDPGVLPLSDVVQLTRVAACNIKWPDHRSCSAVTYGIPLFYNETEQEADYQLTNDQLLDMWVSYSSIDPFAVRLRMLGITGYNVPNDRAVMSSWWIGSFAVLIIILGLGFSLWRWNCFESYTGMTRLSETDSVYSDTRKSDLSLYPTPHQNLPPMFAGDQYDNYLDADQLPKYADTMRVDMGGAFDKGFVRDGELFDLDSDEEIIMSLPDDGKGATRNSSDTRPKDIYGV